MSIKKIIILDDEPTMPLLIKDLIDDEPGFEISEIVSSKNKFLDRVSKSPFDLAVIDVSLKKESLGGIELLSGFKKRGINLPVIILSAYEEIDFALKALQAGAQGYINKMHVTSDFLHACSEVVKGRLFVSGKHGNKILQEYQRTKV
jgi:DNA-binding NarL/FixJ family response regulator